MTNWPSEPESDGAPPDDLYALLAHLRSSSYSFVAPTPATHRTVIGRPEKARARDLRDIFGWSLPFDAHLLPGDLLGKLLASNAIETSEAGLRARVRVSSLGGELFLHSAFPPASKDAVFFGPDTYRFARFLEGSFDGGATDLAVEIGTGSGAGAATVAACFRPARLVATDVNAAALRLAAINLAAAGVKAELRLADGLSGVTEPVDLIVANPPFIAGEGERIYRDGGGMLGAQASLDWALAGTRLLAPAGRLLLYTGSAIVDGRDALHEALSAKLDPRRFDLGYAEIDPDIFGDQLTTSAYRDVERIAAIGAIVTRRP